ncbi:MAG: RecQ family zinc-binding domain-containing protein, partial [Acidobacteriota bacterium]
ALCAAFGETLDAPCGRCSVCLGERVELPAPDPPEVDLEALERALALRVKHPETLGNPRATARFLAGLTSPRLGAARLGRHPLYGVAAGVPFDELLRLVEDASGS